MKRPAGTFYLIGGAADATFKRFAELAGGVRGKLVILPHASSDPGGAARDAATALRARGVGRADTIMPGSPDAMPADTTAVLLTGGDQSNLVRDLPVHLKQALKALLAAGGVVGGTSAGAAAVGKTMIAGGMGEGDWPDADSLILKDGLGLLPGYVIDTHVHERRRPDRLLVALGRIEGVKGIGLDNDTAVEISGGTATVYGAGLARVYSPSRRFRGQAEGKKSVSVRNVLLSVLSEGESFEL